MKKILLPTDYSATSEHAIRYALTFFEEEACEFVLLHAIALPVMGNETGVYTLAETATSAESMLEEQCQQLAGTYGQPYHVFRSRVLAASPMTAIEMMTEAEQFDWIVLGASGNGRSPVLGSVATDVVMLNHANVLVVPPTAPLRAPFNIVLTVDYRGVSNMALFDPLLEVIDQTNGKLTLLTVLNQRLQPANLNRKIRENYRTYFSVYGPLEYFIQDDTVEAGVGHYLETHEADLLVTVPHHRSFWDVLLNRSVSRRLVYRPVLPMMVLCDKTTAQPVSADREEQTVTSLTQAAA